MEASATNGGRRGLLICGWGAEDEEEPLGSPRLPGPNALDSMFIQTPKMGARRGNAEIRAKGTDQDAVRRGDGGGVAVRSTSGRRNSGVDDRVESPCGTTVNAYYTTMKKDEDLVDKVGDQEDRESSCSLVDEIHPEDDEDDVVNDEIENGIDDDFDERRRGRRRRRNTASTSSNRSRSSSCSTRSDVENDSESDDDVDDEEIQDEDNNEDCPDGDGPVKKRRSARRRRPSSTTANLATLVEALRRNGIIRREEEALRDDTSAAAARRRSALARERRAHRKKMEATAAAVAATSYVRGTAGSHDRLPPLKGTSSQLLVSGETSPERASHLQYQDNRRAPSARRLTVDSIESGTSSEMSSPRRLAPRHMIPSASESSPSPSSIAVTSGDRRGGGFGPPAFGAVSDLESGGKDFQVAEELHRKRFGNERSDDSDVLPPPSDVAPLLRPIGGSSSLNLSPIMRPAAGRRPAVAPPQRIVRKDLMMQLPGFGWSEPASAASSAATSGHNKAWALSSAATSRVAACRDMIKSRPLHLLKSGGIGGPHSSWRMGHAAVNGRKKGSRRSSRDGARAGSHVSKLPKIDRGSFRHQQQQMQQLGARPSGSRQSRNPRPRQQQLPGVNRHVSRHIGARLAFRGLSVM